METNQDGLVRPFADFIREHGHGRTHDELSEGMRDLIQKVKDTGRKGSVTLKITVEPMKKDDRMVVVSDSLKLRLPEHDRPAGQRTRSASNSRNRPGGRRGLLTTGSFSRNLSSLNTSKNG